MLFAAEQGAQAVGLTFNPAKCASLHIAGRGVDAVRPTEFSIQNNADYEIGCMRGIPAHWDAHGLSVKQTPAETLRDLIAGTRSIDQSLLAPWQKLDAVGTFLLPRPDFILQGAHIERDYLTEADKIIKKLVKSWLHVPGKCRNLPPSQGGGGLLLLSDLYDLLTVAHSYKMLYSGDAMVRRIAESELERTVSERLKKRASKIDVARYLSGDLDLPKSSGASHWSAVRNAALRSKNKLGLRWVWCQD